MKSRLLGLIPDVSLRKSAVHTDVEKVLKEENLWICNWCQKKSSLIWKKTASFPAQWNPLFFFNVTLSEEVDTDSIPFAVNPEIEML